MAMNSYPWASNNKDRTYTADAVSMPYRLLFGNGVFPYDSSNFQVIAVSGMKIKVMPGAAMINGVLCENNEAQEFTLSTGNPLNPRRDRIILRWDKSLRSISVKVLEGVADPAPGYPAMVRNSSIWDLTLADIYINRGIITISQTNISDRRQINSFCGPVTALQQLNTDSLFIQYTQELTEKIASMDTYFNSMKGRLDGDTGTKITKELTDAAQGSVSLLANLNNNYIKNGKYGIGGSIPKYNTTDFLKVGGIFDIDVLGISIINMPYISQTGAITSHRLGIDRNKNKGIILRGNKYDNLLDEGENLKLTYDRVNDRNGAVDCVMELANGYKEIMGWISVPPRSPGSQNGGRFYEIPAEQANYTRCINLQATPAEGECSYNAYHTVKNGKKCIGITFSGSNMPTLQFTYRMVVE